MDQGLEIHLGDSRALREQLKGIVNQCRLEYQINNPSDSFDTERLRNILIWFANAMTAHNGWGFEQLVKDTEKTLNSLERFRSDHEAIVFTNKITGNIQNFLANGLKYAQIEGEYPLDIPWTNQSDG